MTAATDPGAAARRLARLGGVLYLATFAGGLADVAISNQMIVRADAVATTANILANEPLWRLGFGGEMVGMLCYIGVTAVLYRLLRPVGPTLSLGAAFFSLVGCALGAVAAASLMAPFFFVGGQAQPYMAAAFTPAQLQALAMAAIRLHNVTYNVAMLCFGGDCALLGALIYRSAFIPRILGALLIISGLTDLIHTSAIFLDPPLGVALDPYAMAPAFIGEAAICLWLLIAGVDVPKWRGRFESPAAVPA